MTPDSSEPLAGVDPDTVSPAELDEEELLAAFSAEGPLVRLRAARVCATLAAADVESVEPFLDAVATAVTDDSSPVALRAIAVLDTVAREAPDALDGRVGPLAARADAEIVDVQMTAATALGKAAVARPTLLVPHLGTLIEGIRVTALDDTPPELTEFQGDDATRQTIEEHQQGERERRTAARQTLINVVVAAAEADPAAAADHVEGLTTLLTDDDATVVGGALDALGAVAEVAPDSVRPAREEIMDCLEWPREFVRARAIRALGHLGDDEAVPRLAAIASDDEDEDVAELAAETAAYLRGE